MRKGNTTEDGPGDGDGDSVKGRRILKENVGEHEHFALWGQSL